MDGTDGLPYFYSVHAPVEERFSVIRRIDYLVPSPAACCARLQAQIILASMVGSYDVIP